MCVCMHHACMLLCVYAFQAYVSILNSRLTSEEDDRHETRARSHTRPVRPRKHAQPIRPRQNRSADSTNAPNGTATMLTNLLHLSVPLPDPPPHPHSVPLSYPSSSRSPFHSSSSPGFLILVHKRILLTSPSWLSSPSSSPSQRRARGDLERSRAALVDDWPVDDQPCSKMACSMR